MKPFTRMIVAVLPLVFVASAAAAESDAFARLDEALKSATGLEYGQDAAPWNVVEQIAVGSVSDPKLREEVEQRLLQVLDSNVSRDAKAFICRQLFAMGSARSVAKLEPLLTDPFLAHPARYALGRIEGPEADAALQRALAKTSGKLQIGVLATLGSRRCQAAVPEIAKLTASPDTAVAEAAAAALGNIRGAKAVRALDAARPAAAAGLRQRIDDALMSCADSFLAAGQTAEAVSIYTGLHAADRTPHVRIGALRGLVQAQGDAAAALLAESIRSPDPAVRDAAIGFGRTAQGAEITKTLVDLLPDLPPDARALLLRVLGDRADPAATPALMAAAKSEPPEVRLAALEALGGAGNAAAIDALAQTAAGAGGEEQQIARASLVRLPGAEINGALLRALAAAEPNMRVELIRALAARKATPAVGELFKLAVDNDASVRREAIGALGTLAGEAELATLVALAATPQDAADRAAIEQTLGNVFRRIRDAKKCADVVLPSLAGAPADAKPTLLRLLGVAGTPEAFHAVRAALAEDDAAMRDAAVRTLAEWPNGSAAEELLQLARTAPVQTHKVLALRGYVRLAGMSDNPTAMYTRALELAERTEDKRLVLAGLGTAGSTEALQLVEKHLNDAALQAEAAAAIVQIAGRLRESDAARAKAALNNVLATVKDAAVRGQAQEAVNEMEQYDGHVLAWLITGLYEEKKKRSRDIFDMAFPPEKPDAKDVAWKSLKAGIGDWGISLDAVFGSVDHCAVYVRTRVWVPAAQDARLELGSDDAVKAWLNGKQVHAHYLNRSMAPRQDLVDVQLQQGWNDLMLEIIEHEGGWGFCCRVRQRNGTALPDLKVEAK